MKKTFLILLVLSLSVCTGYAQQLNGIQIDSSSPVVIFINGTQASPPVQTCFVCTTQRATYLIEAYNPNRPFLGPKRIRPLFSKRVRYIGKDVLHIKIETGIQPLPLPQPDPYPVFEPMDPQMFSELTATLRRSQFDNEKEDIIRLVARQNHLSAKQIATLGKLFTFDDARENAVVQLYPCCVDPENFFVVLNLFPHASHKQSVIKRTQKY